MASEYFLHADPNLPSALEVRQAMEDEATGMDLDTVVNEVTTARENGHMNPMASILHHRQWSC